MLSSEEYLNAIRVVGRSVNRPSGAVLAIIDGPAPFASGFFGLPTTLLGEGACARSPSACEHGSLTAALVCGCPSAGIQPLCWPDEVLLAPVLRDHAGRSGASVDDLIHALHAVMDRGANLVNLSLAVMSASGSQRRWLWEAMTRASQAGCPIVVAAGIFGPGTSSPLTEHPWVLPVVAFNHEGTPLPNASSSPSIARAGVGVLGEALPAADANGRRTTFSGSSAACAAASALLVNMLAHRSADARTILHFIRGGPPKSAYPTYLTPSAIRGWGDRLSLGR